MLSYVPSVPASPLRDPGGELRKRLTHPCSPRRVSKTCQLLSKYPLTQAPLRSRLIASSAGGRSLSLGPPTPIAGDQKRIRSLSDTKAFKGFSPGTKSRGPTSQHNTRDPFQWVLTGVPSTTLDTVPCRPTCHCPCYLLFLKILVCHLFLGIPHLSLATP